MTKIITAAQMQELDRRTITEACIPGTTLMERAGSGVVSCLEQAFGSARGKRVTVLCGKGNNGGDGFVVARLLNRRQANARVIAMAPVSELGRDAATMYRSVYSQIFTLPASCQLYPGHDYRGLTATSVAEERAFNPRLGGELSETDFIGFMENLGLAHPKQMDVAVPANMKCGRPDVVEGATDEPDWAPLNYTFAGVWEIVPEWVEENIGSVCILDVRERDDLFGRVAVTGEIFQLAADGVTTIKQRAADESQYCNDCRERQRMTHCQPAANESTQAGKQRADRFQWRA